MGLNGQIGNGTGRAPALQHNYGSGAIEALLRCSSASENRHARLSKCLLCVCERAGMRDASSHVPAPVVGIYTAIALHRGEGSHWGLSVGPAIVSGSQVLRT